MFYYTLAFETTYPVTFYDIFLTVNVACFDLSAVHFLFFCQCCPAWYPGQSLIPDEELDTDVGMQQPALHNTTYPKCRVNAEPTVQEMIYWWGFKENHINLDVCYLEVIILRVVASSLGIKRLFSSLVYFILCWAIICEMKKQKSTPPPPTNTSSQFRIINAKMEVKTSLIQCVLSHALCWPCWKSLSNICIPHVELKCLKLEIWMLVLLISCLCSKSNIQDLYNRLK